MKQFIFNPEHDMCLADGRGSFIPPAAIVEFASRCRWIGRYMGDVVKEGVDLSGGMPDCEDGRVLEEKGSGKITEVVPWGWNRCLRDKLLKEGIPAELMPDDGQLDFIRESSRRELALELLEHLHKESGYSGGECPGGEYKSDAADNIGLTGESRTCAGVQMIPADYRIVAHSIEGIEKFLHKKGRVVLKAPLSGSGKGVRFVTGKLMETDMGWCKRTLQRQGAVIVEQRMDIVKEFAMLFEVTGGMRKSMQEEMPQVREGVGVSEAGDVPQVQFRGYSLFYASNGAYKGNLLASNEYMEKELDKYVPAGELRRVRRLVERFLREKLQGKYVGFVGVDQFVASSNGEKNDAGGERFVGTVGGKLPAGGLCTGGTADTLPGRKYCWNPAVEINLRMTMGLVARNIYDSHAAEYGIGEGTHCFEPERGVFTVEGSQPCVE